MVFDKVLTHSGVVCIIENAHRISMLCEIPEAVLSQTHPTYQKKSDFLFLSKKAATIGNKQLQMEDKQKKHGNGSGIFPPPHKHTYHKLLPPDHDDAKLADDTQIMRHFAIFTKLKTPRKITTYLTIMVFFRSRRLSCRKHTTQDPNQTRYLGLFA